MKPLPDSLHPSCQFLTAQDEEDAESDDEATASKGEGEDDGDASDGGVRRLRLRPRRVAAPVVVEAADGDDPSYELPEGFRQA